METNPYNEEFIPYTPQYSQQEQSPEYQEERTFASEEWVSEYQEERAFPPEPFAQYQKIQPVPFVPEAPLHALLQAMKQHLVIISLFGFAAFGGLMAAHFSASPQPTGPAEIFPAAQHSENHYFYYLQGGDHHCHHHHSDNQQNDDPQNQDSY